MTLIREAPAAPASTRPASAGTAIVIALHFILWAITMIGGWLYWDDFILQGQAARLGLSTDLLLNNHDGHVMPFTYAVVWFLQDLSGLNYALVATSMAVGQTIFVVSAVVATRSLLGRGMPSLVALAVLLLSPIMLPGFTWWSAALTLVPLMSCMLLATVAQVHYLRTGSLGALITTYALAVVALGFFEKSVLIPFWLFGVTVLVSRNSGLWSSVRDSLKGHWRMWLGWLALLVVYLVAFAQVAQGRTHLPTGPGQVLSLIGRAVFRTIAPGLVGGPVTWTPVDFSASFANPPWWLILFGGLVVTAVVIAGVRRPGISRKAWVVAGAYLAIDLATFAVGRLGPTGDPGVIQAGRYVATAMIGISIAIAATAAAYRDELSAPRWRWPLTGFVATIGLLALLSCLAYAAIWSDNPAKKWVGNARADLAGASDGAPLLDQDVPDFILLPVTHPYNQASWFLAPLAQQPGFATSTTALQLLDNRGRLIPATVDGAAALPPPQGCYVVPAGSSVTVPLEHALIAWAHTVRIDYAADRAGFVNVRIGSGNTGRRRCPGRSAPGLRTRRRRGDLDHGRCHGLLTVHQRRRGGTRPTRRPAVRWRHRHHRPDAATQERSERMSSRTYRLTEIVGTSPDSVDQAIRNGVNRASQSLRHIDWFEVTDIRGYIRDGDVNHYQVTLKIGFRLEDE